MTKGPLMKKKRSPLSSEGGAVGLISIVLLRRDSPQRSLIIAEMGGVQHLETSVMCAVERSHNGWAACRRRSMGRSEPQSQVVHLDRVKWRIESRIRERPVEHARRCRGSGRHGEGLVAEAADERLAALSKVIGLDPALKRGHAERCARYLGDEQSKLGVGWQPGDADVHMLNESDRGDRHRAPGIGQTAAGARGNVHTKGDRS